MEAWKEFLKKQDEEFGIETITRWLRSLKIVHFDACNLYLEAKSPFQISWFEEHIRPKLASSFFNNNHSPIRVHLSPFEDPATKKKPKKIENQPPLSSYPLFAPDPLDPHATFENFHTCSQNEVPFQFLQDIALQSENPSTFNPVYLYGENGVGKTHLLTALANVFAKKGMKIWYARAETFTEHVVRAIRKGTMEAFRKAYRHVDVLLLDDIHILARRAATQEELFHTFNTLHMENKLIVLSGRVNPQQLEDIEARLISRFEWGIALHLEKIPLAQIKVLLQKRIENLKFPLKDSIIDFLTQTFPSSLKAIIRALDLLILRSHLEKIPSLILTPELASIQLKELIEEEKKQALTPLKIIHFIADHYGIRPEDILGTSQTQECAFPRQLAMYFCRMQLSLPYQKIGQFFSRDHSTVMTSVKQIQKKLETEDKATLDALEIMSKKLLVKS